MTDQWYYAQNGNQQGPISEAELKKLAASEKLLPSDLVWKKGMDEWKPAAEVSGLLPENLPNAGPPPMPPEGPPKIATAGAPKQGMGDFAEKAKTVAQQTMTNTKEYWKKLGGTQKAYFAAGVGIVVLLLLVWMVSGGNKITAADLQAEYEDDEKAAHEDYGKRILVVSGVVENARYYESLGHTQVQLQTKSDDYVVCAFDGRKSEGVDLSRLSRGDKVIVEGKCSGLNMLGGVVLGDCVLKSSP